MKHVVYHNSRDKSVTYVEKESLHFVITMENVAYFDMSITNCPYSFTGFMIRSWFLLVVNVVCLNCLKSLNVFHMLLSSESSPLFYAWLQTKYFVCYLIVCNLFDYKNIFKLKTSDSYFQLAFWKIMLVNDFTFFDQFLNVWTIILKIFRIICFQKSFTELTMTLLNGTTFSTWPSLTWNAE